VKLPNAELAVVDIAKLHEYSLSQTHSEGKHKARVFAASLGFTTADAERLRVMILKAVLMHEAIQGAQDEHGTRYIVDFETQGLRDGVTIRTAWIIDEGETIPRLISCYVKRN
jgi:hypothetical protein